MSTTAPPQRCIRKKHTCRSGLRNAAPSSPMTCSGAKGGAHHPPFRSCGSVVSRLSRRKSSGSTVLEPHPCIEGEPVIDPAIDPAIGFVTASVIDPAIDPVIDPVMGPVIEPVIEP